MLPQKRRIPRKDFKYLLEQKRYFNSSNFSLRNAHSTDKARFAVSVSKKVSRKAVERNRLRRRSYSVLREVVESVAPGLYLITAKPTALNLKGEELKKELVSLIRSIRS